MEGRRGGWERDLLAKTGLISGNGWKEGNFVRR